jgi:sulfur-carrier protein
VATVHLPSPLRRLTHGQATVRVDGADLRAVLDALDRTHPGVAGHLLDDRGHLHRYLHVFVDDDDVRDLRELDTPVGADATIVIVPAVAGGAPSGCCP